MSIPTPLYTSGLDLSHYNSVVDFAAVAESGVKFCYQKATQGASYVDPMLAKNHAGAKAAGLAVGIYHVFVGSAGDQNLTNFMAQWHEYPPDMAAALDCEPGSLTEQTEPIALSWLAAVHEATGKQPLLYASPSSLQSLCDPAFKTAASLWIAHYTDAAQPNLMSWAGWVFWQHSQSGSVPGIVGNVDLDRWNGSPEEFETWIGDSGRTAASLGLLK